MSNVLNPEIETMPVEKLKELQLSRLKSSVERAYHTSEFYRGLYDKAGVKPADIRRLEDVRKLPFLEKAAVRGAYPWGAVTAPREDLREMHSTSGTTGEAVLMFATENDLNTWAELNARELWMVGIRPGDKLLNAYGYGLPTGGFGFHYGARAHGRARNTDKLRPGRTPGISDR